MMPMKRLTLIGVVLLGVATYVLGLAGRPATAVAGAQNATLVAIPPNTALDLGEYSCDQPVDRHVYNPHECWGITDYSGFVYDGTHHQFVMFGGGHATTFRDDVSVFDFRTLTWSSDYPSTLCSEMTLANMDKTHNRWATTGNPFSRHTYDMTAYAPTTGEYFLLSGPVGTGSCAPGIDPSTGTDAFYLTPRLSAYNTATRTWTTEDRVIPWNGLSAAEFDPISGKILILSTYGLWVFDPATRAMEQALDQFPNPLGSDMGYANNLTYFPPNQRFYYIARETPTRVFELQVDRANWSTSTVTELPVGAGVPDTQESGWIYDPINQIIGGGVRDGVFHAYNPLTNTWTSRTMVVQSAAGETTIGNQAFHSINFDPVDGVFVFITEYANGARVWAYRYGGAAPTPAPPPTFAPGQTERVYLPHVRR